MRTRSLRAVLSSLAAPVLALLLAVLLALVFVGSAAPARADGPEEAKKLTRLRELQEEVMKALAEKRYDDAAAKCREQIAIRPESETQHYNLACALARLGKTSESLESLKNAIDHGFFDADFMDSDEDLASVRGEKGYADLRALVVAREARAEEMAYEEAGDPIEGTKTIEGKPANGLRWRLRIGTDATAKKPHRLVVWLHPSGGSMNEAIEPMAKDLACKGFALLVLTAKNWNYWNGKDLARLSKGTLEDVEKAAGEGLDAKRPVLMGFSAGGQAAIALWTREPGRFGGLVIDAAYPIDASALDNEGKVTPIALPAGDEKKRTPLYVLVGDADPGHGMWKTVEGPWRDAGVPLTVTYVPDGTHEWLVTKERLPALLAWLGEVAAGRLPGTKAVTPGVPGASSETPPLGR